MKIARASTTLLFTALALAGCGSKAGPVIDSFSADANPAPAGVPLTLRWSVQNADTLSIDQGVGSVTGKTTTTVTPQATTTYTLTASSGGGSATRTLTVAVSAPSIVWFTATPSQVQAGAAVTLTWSLTGGNAVSIDGTAVAGNSLVVHPTVTTSYTLTLPGAARTGAPSAKALVRVVSAPQITGFTASPAAIAQGSPSVLSWGGTGLGYSLDNGVGDVGAQTRATVRPAQTTTYTLTARGPAGLTATALQTVTVTQATGTRSLAWLDPPTIPSGAVLKLVADPSSTSTLLVLKLLTTRQVSASALAFGLALDATKVALDAAQSGDVSPGFVVNTATALDPGPAPAAARASLRSDGPLANVLTLGISLKPEGGVTPADKSLPADTELCRFRLVIAPGAGPGPVFPLSKDPAHPDPSDPYNPYKALLRSGQSPSATLPASTVALGTLTLL